MSKFNVGKTPDNNKGVDNNRKSDIDKTPDNTDKVPDGNNKPDFGKPDTSNYPVPNISQASPDVVTNYQRRVDNLRNEFSHPDIRNNGNVAIADIDIDGLNIDLLQLTAEFMKKIMNLLVMGKQNLIH